MSNLIVDSNQLSLKIFGHINPIISIKKQVDTAKLNVGLKENKKNPFNDGIRDGILITKLISNCVNLITK